ncbi:Annexin A3 (Annexin III) [Schistosoma japonicum]|nr:Annexin A3 (Annexin III) [Schistosoma japonicum]
MLSGVFVVAYYHVKSILGKIQDVNEEMKKIIIEDLLTDTSILLANELYAAMMMRSDLQLVTSILIDFRGDEFNQVESVYKIYSNKSIWQDIEHHFGEPVKNILYCTVDSRKHELKMEHPINGRGGKPIVNRARIISLLHILTRTLDSNKDIQQSLGELLCLLDPFELEMLNKQFKKIDLYTINKVYKVKYGKYLLNDIKVVFDGVYDDVLTRPLRKPELSDRSILGKIQDVNEEMKKIIIEDLLTDTSILLANELYAAMMMRSDLQLVTSILIDFRGDEFNQVESVYKIYSNKSIWQDIEHHFGEPVKNILYCTVDSRKHELKMEHPIKGRGGKPIVNRARIISLLHILTRTLDSNKDIQQSLGELLCLLDPFELEMLNKQFKKKTGEDLSAVIQNETFGKTHDVLMAIFNHSVSKPMYFATIIHDAIHEHYIGILKVFRLLIFRSEIDLYTINKVYKVQYGKYLLNDIKKEFNGISDNVLTRPLRNPELSDSVQHSLPISFHEG